MKRWGWLGYAGALGAHRVPKCLTAEVASREHGMGRNRWPLAEAELRRAVSEGDFYLWQPGQKYVDRPPCGSLRTRRPHTSQGSPFLP